MSRWSTQRHGDDHQDDAEPEPVASSTSDATVRDAKHGSVPLRRVRAGEIRWEEFLYERYNLGRRSSVG